MRSSEHPVLPRITDGLVRERTACLLDLIGVRNTPGPTFSKTARVSPSRDRVPDLNPHVNIRNKPVPVRFVGTHTCVRVAFLPARHAPSEQCVARDILQPSFVLPSVPVPGHVYPKSQSSNIYVVSIRVSAGESHYSRLTYLVVVHDVLSYFFAVLHTRTRPTCLTFFLYY